MAEWDTAYINNLPDSSFLYIEPGGEKDDEGKTTPRSLRHLPIKDASGEIDLPHLRNALSRLGQPGTGGAEGDRWLTANLRRTLVNKARRLLLQATSKKEMSFSRAESQVRKTVYNADPNEPVEQEVDSSWYAVEVFTDSVIIETGKNEFYRAPYTRNERGVTLAPRDEWVRVQRVWVPVDLGDAKAYSTCVPVKTG